MILLFVYFRTKSKIKYAGLTNEMLTQELKHKKKELTNFAIHSSEINKLIKAIQLKAKGIGEIEDTKKLKTKITELTTELGKNSSLLESKQNIEAYIDISYTDFIHSLEKINSHLTDREKRICSLILVNCSSKEIAEILSISPKSINNSRSVIRTKLNIEEKENMNLFFNNLVKTKK